MQTMEETIASFLAINPSYGGLNDIQMGENLLAVLPEEDAGTRVAILQKLGSLYIETQALELDNAIEAAKECYRSVLTLADAYENIQWRAAASAGAAYTLLRKYELSRSESDFDTAEAVFLELIESCDQFGQTEEANSNRMNYAKLLMGSTKGDRFSQVDKAIAVLREVRGSISPEANPDRYARVLYNLGAALLQQNEEPHTRDLYFNEAVDYFFEALQYRPAERDRVGRVRILRTLADVLPDWEGADSLAHAEYLASMALAEAEALESGKDIPKNATWTTLKQKQSALYWDYDDIPSNRSDILAAINEHEGFLKKISHSTHPYRGAEWHGGLARLLARVAIEDNDRDLIQKASSAFLYAIEKVQEEGDPRLRLLLFRELGRLQHESGNWEGSLFANSKAVDIGLHLADIAGTDVSRTNELESFTRAIHFAAFAAAQLDKHEEALEFAEIGRARWLDEAIRIASIRISSLPDKFKVQVDEAQAALLELERREYELQDEGVGGATRRLENYLGVPIGGSVKIRMTADPNGVEEKLRKELSDVRQQLQKAHENLGILLNSVEDRSVVLPRPTAKEVIAISQQSGFPIIYLLSSAWGSVAIVVNEKIVILQIPSLKRKMIQDLLYGTNDYVRRANSSGGNLEPVLDAVQTILDEHLLPPIHQWCVENKIDSIAIVGLGDIGLLPLQVSTVPAGLNIRLLPSARSLSLSLKTPKSEKLSEVKLLTAGGVISNDLPPLEFSGIESRFFAATFQQAGAAVSDMPRSAKRADMEAQIAGATHILFSCHGSFKLFSPLTSTIHFEGDEVLPVSNLLRPALKLIGVELVILSACNSASTEYWRTPDEAIGFPAAFLAAGAKTVVAAQWPVNDFATLLLMQQFCIEILNNDLMAAKALANAQRWLRNATRSDIVKALKVIQDGLGQEEMRSKRVLRELSDEIMSLKNECPFSDRQFWAAFVCVGA